MATYYIEFGVDLNAKKITEDGKGFFFLPTGIITSEREISTCFHFNRGDQVGFRIFNISSIASKEECALLVPDLLSLSFQNARPQGENSPFEKETVRAKNFSVLGEDSLIFGHKLKGVAASFGGEETITIGNFGFFKATYKLEVGGCNRVFSQDPEWIIDDDGGIHSGCHPTKVGVGSQSRELGVAPNGISGVAGFQGLADGFESPGSLPQKFPGDGDSIQG